MFIAKFCVFNVAVLLSFNSALLGFLTVVLHNVCSHACCVRKLKDAQEYAFCIPVAFLKEVPFPSLQNICG